MCSGARPGAFGMKQVCLDFPSEADALLCIRYANQRCHHSGRRRRRRQLIWRSCSTRQSMQPTKHESALCNLHWRFAGRGRAHGRGRGVHNLIRFLSLKVLSHLNLTCHWRRRSTWARARRTRRRAASTAASTAARRPARTMRAATGAVTGRRARTRTAATARSGPPSTTTARRPLRRRGPARARLRLGTLLRRSSRRCPRQARP